MTKVDRKYRVARQWSNKELRKIAPLLKGDIVNVSAGEDIDKEGATYESYFIHKHRYSLTNYGPGTFRGFQGRQNEYLLDLTKDVSPEMERRFDVVFNHTTLEHIYKVRKAFANLCLLSRDIVIIVVPFAQVHHENEAYKDFWRFTPTALRCLFEENNFEVMYEASNDDFNAAVYLFFLASRKPEKWRRKLPDYEPIEHAGDWIGTPDAPIGALANSIKKKVQRAIKLRVSKIAKIFKRPISDGVHHEKYSNIRSNF